MVNIIKEYQKVVVYELKNGNYTVEINTNPVEITEGDKGETETQYQVDQYRIKNIPGNSIEPIKQFFEDNFEDTIKQILERE